MLRFQSQLQIDNIADEQLDNQFEVVMPTLYLNGKQKKTDNSWTSLSGIWDNVTGAASNAYNAYTPIVEEIVFGVRNFGTNSRRVRTGWCNVPDDIQNYQDVSITFFCSSGMLIQYYLDSWKKLIFDDDGEYYNPMSVYKKDIEVYFFGPGNIGVGSLSVAHYTLKGCFPYYQDTYKLEYTEDPKRLRLMAKFKMDKIVFDSTLKNKAIVSELVSSPLSIGDKLISGLFSKSSEASQYDADSIYG